MSDLRKLIEHIEQGGELIRELDPITGRIVSKPVTENIAKLLGAAAGGAGLALGANWLKDKFSSDKPQSNNPQSNNSNGSSAGNISDFSSSPAAIPPAGQNSNQNPNGNAGHDSSNIGPNDDPADPKTWPPGVKPASDFGYLDNNGMWIPTPFHFRTEEGRWRIPTNSPANLIGIRVNQYTPFQQKVQKMQEKVVYLSSSAIEQQKSVNLPSGAPQIPGYKQIDASRFDTNMNEPGVNKTMNWLYAYQNGKNIILIAPMLFYNTKRSIGRHYQTWGSGRLRSGGAPIKTQNGTIHVAAKDFNANDMILDVVIHSTDPNIGPKILQNIKI